MCGFVILIAIFYGGHATGLWGNHRAGAGMRGPGLVFPLAISGNELGEVPSQDRVSCVIQVTNRSDATVDVEELRARCQCLEVKPRSFQLNCTF
jgi:hypothetical protein